MKIKELVTELCALEGMKSQIQVGDMREVIGKLSDILFSELEFEGDTCIIKFDGAVAALFVNGAKRAKKKKSGKRKKK